MRYGYCISCKRKRSSKWHNVRENWIEFCIAPEEQAKHNHRKNKVCNDCYHRLNEEKTDPLVKEFGDGSDKPAPKIKRSKLSGHGLFASRDYDRHELVALYLGTTMADTKESLKSVKDRSYLTKWNGFLIDGKYNWQGLRGLGRFINCPSKDQKANCYWGQVADADGQPLHRAIRATRKICRGEEFLLDYGPQYWNRMGGRPLSSQHKKRGRPFKLDASGYSNLQTIKHHSNNDSSDSIAARLRPRNKIRIQK